jgi:Domain of unknown function (DUF5606)
MDLKEIMSVSGMPGLYKVMANRTDGLIVEGLHDKARKFVSSRQHMFTPLENITLYTTDDSIELKEVLSNMKKNEGEHPVPDIKKTDDSSLRKYMKTIVPNYDEEKVYASDIKKLIKWYELLNANQLVSILGEESKETESENKVDDKETAVTSEENSAELSVAEKPKKATKAKKAEPAEGTEEKPKKKPSKKAE